MRKRTTISATELRVHLGEMLRRLEHEDFVIEKGGVPLATLSRYRSGEAASPARPRASSPSILEEEYERSLSKRGDSSRWDEALDAIRANPMDEEEAEAIKAEIYRMREWNAKFARYYIDDVGDPVPPEQEEWTRVPARLRYVRRPPVDAPHVADRGDEEYKP